MNGATSAGPNFFLIGAAKSGTTSLATYLDQHPQVFLCKPKEPNFFAFPEDSRPIERGPAPEERLFELLLQYSVTSRDAYLALFAEAPTASARGDASVRYLYASDAAERIAQFAPDARLIAMLRHPVDRMYSHYYMNVGNQLEPARSFREALAEEDRRVTEGWGWDWHYRRASRYAEQLARWYEHFTPEQIHIELYRDFVANPDASLARIFLHLGVDAEFQVDRERRALVGSAPKARWLRDLIRDENPLKSLAKRVVPRRIRKAASAWNDRVNRQAIPPLDPALRNELAVQFADDAETLSTLLGRRVAWQ
ncbi:MAG: sulfotransferase [Planctomycetales bacterium]|nr:sulfotransferase [Planctomycetales bacterium]